MITEVKPVRIFIAYSHKDRVFLDELRSAAVPLERSGKVRIWYDGNIEAGKVWDAEIKTNLHSADIILLLISNNSLASDYFYEQEVADALERHRRDEARVVPVILSHCFWNETPLYELQGVPTGAKPVSTWPDRHEAWHNVLSRVRDTIRELKDLRDAAARAVQEAADQEQAILAAAEETADNAVLQFDTQIKIYAEVPMGDIFVRTSVHFQSEITIFVITLNSKDSTQGSFRLVEDEKTLRYFFSIMDVLRDACLFDSIGTSTLTTQNYVMQPGRVELKDGFWFIIEKIRLGWL